MSETATLIKNITNVNTTEPSNTNTTLVEGIDTLAQQEELYSSWAILIFIILLSLTLFVSYILQRRKIRFIHESTVAIFIGIFMGAIISLINDPTLNKKLSFKYTYFFNLLLPPIILNSGYELERKTFFKNFGLILTFAFVGTTISTLVIGTLTYLVNLTGIGGLNMTFIECLMFGSILSSTDPVTILAIFSQLKVDPKLYSIIFGESMLNDSVAIVLFESLQHVVNKEMEISLLWEGFGDFIGNFVGSLIIGLGSGLTISLILKFSKLHTIPLIESSLITLLAYGTYFFSNTLQMSGIVSLLFCSIVLKHYAYNNMSEESQTTTTSIFRLLAQLSENFCFIYLGISLFTLSKGDYNAFLIFCTFITVCLARYCSTIPLSKVINSIQAFYGAKEDAISRQYQLMLFWAGLRGAVAFALAMEAESPSVLVMRSTILIVVVLTVIFFGGTTPFFIDKLKIRTGVEFSSPNIDFRHAGNSPDSPYAYDHLEADDSTRQSLDSNTVGLRAKSPERPSLDIPAPVRASIESDNANWFGSIDDHILKPMFTHQKPPNMRTDRDHGRSESSMSNVNTYSNRNENSLGVIGIESDLNEVIVEDRNNIRKDNY